MLIPVSGSGDVGEVTVNIVNDGTFSTAYWSEQATKKIISVAINMHPLIRDQALDLQNKIERVVNHYIKSAVIERKLRDAMIAELMRQNDVAAVIRADTGEPGTLKL